MTDTQGGLQPLKSDEKGRVQTPPARREEILDAFERSGVSGVKFAKMAGIKYQTLASWVVRRRREREASGTSTSKTAAIRPPMRFLEAVVPDASSATMSLEVELPGGVRLRLSRPEHLPLAIELIRNLRPC